MIAGEARQSFVQLFEHRIHMAEHAVGELLLTQFVPHMLLRVQLGRVGRRGQQADVLWHHQIPGPVRTGAVHDHDHEVVGVGAADLVEELAHAQGVHLAADHPIEVALQRADRAVDIHELALIAIEHDRAPRQGRPAAARPRHAAKPGFVLEHQPHSASAQIDFLQDGRQRLG